MLRKFTTTLLPFFRPITRSTHTKPKEIEKLIQDSKKLIEEYQSDHKPLWQEVERKVEQIGDILQNDRTPTPQEKKDNIFGDVLTRYYSTPEETGKLHTLFTLESHFINKGSELTEEEFKTFKKALK